eukprot:3801714-Rhodomonas_salina.1
MEPQRSREDWMRIERREAGRDADQRRRATLAYMGERRDGDAPRRRRRPAEEQCPSSVRDRAARKHSIPRR